MAQCDKVRTTPIFVHFSTMAATTPHCSSLEKAEQEKAENKAQVEVLDKKIEKIEARIGELRALTERTRAQEEELSDLRKDKDALREEKKVLDAKDLALINRLTQLEAQQGAG